MAVNDRLDPDAATLEASAVATVGPDDPLVELQGRPVPGVPDVVRNARRDRAREALFGRPVVRRFGRYIVLGELGRGGMGTVLDAYDPQLDRKVAIKLLHDPEHERHASRLEREAKALAKLSHPNVVQVYEVGFEGEHSFVAMEQVQGQTLRQWQGERRPWRACVAVYLQVGRGLAAAHAKGLVHRDFKPGNCILDEDGRGRVLDFGLVGGGEESALDAATLEVIGGSAEVPRPASEQTRTGTVLGTPAYMSPEQFRGQRADARSDQFSFCVSLYEALYGERPFASGSMAELWSALTQGVVRPPRTGVRVPLPLRRIVVRGLAADPDDRWPTMNALLEQLERLVAPRARRWALVSLAVGVLGVGVGLGLGGAVEHRQRCSDAERRLTTIWDDERRAQVEAAIVGTGLSYAPGTWERVERRLDDYADAWVGKHVEVCEAGIEDAQGERDRRLRLDCMHERASALRAAVDVLARADAEVVENAVELATSLPGLGRCDDLDALRAVVPPPEDREVRAEVDALREQLADVVAALEAGRHVAALEQVEPLVERAEALGYGPLVAEAKLRRGRLRHDDARYAEAEQDLEDAYDVAMEHRHDEVAWQAAELLTVVVGDRQQRHAEGEVWAQVVMAHAKRSGDRAAVAGSLNSASAVLMAQGQYEQARTQLERVLQIREDMLGADHPHVALSMFNVGLALTRQGEFAQAQLRFGQALQIQQRELGANHPRVAATLASLGVALVRQAGKHQEAQAMFERALEIDEQAYGAEHPRVAADLDNLGTVFADQGDYEQARLHYERASGIWQAVLGDRHPDVAFSFNNLGNVLREHGQFDQAQRYFERALEIYEESLGAEHPSVAMTLNDLGNLIGTRGEYARAQRYLERSLRIREQVLGAEHPDVAMTLGNLGAALAGQGQYEAAQRHFERALEISKKAHGPEHPDVARSLNNLATVLQEQGEFEEALVHHRRALEIRQKALGAEHPHVAETLLNMGQIMRARGEFEEAEVRIQRALRIVETTMGVEHPWLANALSGLAEIALARGEFEAARAYAERAVAVREGGAVAPALLAEVRFVLARALWGEAKPGSRERAVALAGQARDALAEAGEGMKGERLEVERWIARHGGL